MFYLHRRKSITEKDEINTNCWGNIIDLIYYQGNYVNLYHIQICVIKRTWLMTLPQRIHWEYISLTSHYCSNSELFFKVILLFMRIWTLTFTILSLKTCFKYFKTFGYWTPEGLLRICYEFQNFYLTTRSYYTSM
jgi:serine protease inhibitor